jgi:hypothetical protein
MRFFPPLSLGLLALTSLVVHAQPTPGQPGVPQLAPIVFSEDFQNQDTAAGAIALTAYVGANGERYTADAAYLPPAGQCNGWVVSQNLLGLDAGCNVPFVKGFAYVLGLAQGQTSADALTNNAVTSVTRDAVTIPAGYQFKTLNDTPAIGAMPLS